MRFAISLGVALAATLAVFAEPRAQTSEEQVKATFLYRFASYVSWPASAFSDQQAPIRLCVIGAEPLARVLQRATATQRVDGRPFEVRELTNPSAAAQCQLIYVAGERVYDTLRAVHGRPVLTVTDGEVDRGDVRGIVHFVIVENRVRFHIDDARAAESHLSIDPRLLGLAVSVRRRETS
ncbi:MAG: YfiR family protein [Vitreimonas sp.]